MKKMWCPACQADVPPVWTWSEIGPEGGSGQERAGATVFPVCPNDDGTAAHHLMEQRPDDQGGDE
jgi:hypothetical protein